MMDATAPDSVGVITPSMMPAITTTGMAAGTRPSSSTLTDFDLSLLTPAGKPGPSTPYRKITSASAATISRPGTMPAMKSGAIGCTATITGLIAAASVLSWVLAFQGVPDLVVETMKNLTSSPFVFLLLVIGLMLVLGMFLESISVLIVVVPLLMPVVNSLGIDPIHFGVVCTVATVIGLVTPPVGPGLYIAMVQAQIRMGPLFKATVPFLAAVLAVLVLVAAVPELSTWLPSVTTSK